MNQNLRQPRALYMLFFAEMWERFSFYGMKALLLLYMVSELKIEDKPANRMLGAYLALVYALPMLGGFLADTLLGIRKAILWGGITMAIGHFVLAIPFEGSFFAGLGFIIVGNGFFKPNISSLVGRLYEENDPRRDRGYVIFYMGINIGAALGSVICGALGQLYSWHLGFGIAGVFMLLGLIVFLAFQKLLGEHGLKPQNAITKSSDFKWEYLIFPLSWLIVPLSMLLIKHYVIMDFLIYPIAAVAFIFLLVSSAVLGKDAGPKLLAATILILSSILFWTFFEQGGGALNLFTLRNVNTTVLGVHLPSTAINNFINPFFIVVLGGLFTWLWKVLSARNLEPSTPLKFALGILQLGLGFYLFYIGTQHAAGDGMVSLFWLAAGYLFLSTGELCVSPIGLSMVTKLSPLQMTGLIMGIWFLASAMGQYFAGIVGTWMAVPSHQGTELLSAKESLKIYGATFLLIAKISVAAGIVSLVISPLRVS